MGCPPLRCIRPPHTGSYKTLNSKIPRSRMCSGGSGGSVPNRISRHWCGFAIVRPLQQRLSHYSPAFTTRSVRLQDSFALPGAHSKDGKLPLCHPSKAVADFPVFIVTQSVRTYVGT